MVDVMPSSSSFATTTSAPEISLAVYIVKTVADEHARLLEHVLPLLVFYHRRREEVEAAAVTMLAVAVRPAGVVTPTTPPLTPKERLVSPTRAFSPVEEAASSLRSLVTNLAPIEAGVGGAYLAEDAAGNSLGVFKPAYEEPGMPGNRKGNTDPSGSAVKRGFRPGMLHANEVAAYLIDSRTPPQLSAGVPPTGLATLQGRHGSLQAYVTHESSAEDMGPSAFSAADVQKMAVLDMRLANCDRHAGNVLLTERTEAGWRLTPIDHAYALPATLEDPYFEWQSWPQARRPLDATLRPYVAGLDAKADAMRLRRALPGLISEESLLIHRVATAHLQRGVASGATLAAIAGAMTRNASDAPSQLELACARAMGAEVFDASAIVVGGEPRVDAFMARLHVELDAIKY